MISTISRGLRLLGIGAERLFCKREKLDEELAKLNAKIARVKKARADLDLQLEGPMPLGEPLRTRDGRVVERKIIQVTAIIATDEWFASHRGKVIREGYSYPKYATSDA